MRGSGRERRGGKGEEGREDKGRAGRGGENDLTHPLLQIPGYATAAQYVINIKGQQICNDLNSDSVRAMKDKQSPSHNDCETLSSSSSASG